MINLDDRLLENLDQSELFLLCHIVKRLNRGMFCFPSNKTLLEDTGWAIEKLQKVKKTLVDLGYLSIEQRFSTIDRQTTNIYKVKTSLIGAYVGGDRLSAPPENPIPPLGKSDTTDPSENPTTEVLTREEVLTSDSYESVHQQPLSLDSSKEKATATSKKKPADPFYKEFVRVWCEAYPDLGFDALSGKKIKSLIEKTKKRLEIGGKDVTVEAAVWAFQYVIAYVKRDNHWCNGKSISVFESKYLEIILELKNGRKGGTKISFWDRVNAL